MRIHAHSRHLLTSAGTVALVLALCGCVSTTTPAEKSEITGSVSAAPTAPPKQRSEAEWRREAESLGERYRADPSNADVAIQYALALRGMGQRSQAAAVLEQASIQNPDNQALLGAYGRALADIGNYSQAL